MLKIEVKDLKEGPVTLVLSHSAEFFDLSDETFDFHGRVKGNITFNLMKEEVCGKGELKVQARCRCVRCLEMMEIELKPKVSLIYSPDPMYKKESGVIDIASETVNYFNGRTIYPRDQIREVLLIQLPNFPHCSNDCRGLCAKCGKNLNRGECICKREEKAEELAERQDWKAKLERLKKEI